MTGKKINLKQKCPECNSHNFISEGWEIYCKECGLVIKTVYQYTAGYKIRISK